jgi:hypothetical protein
MEGLSESILKDFYNSLETALKRGS